MIGLLAELAVALLSLVGVGGGLRRAPSLADLIVVIAGEDVEQQQQQQQQRQQQQQ